MTEEAEEESSQEVTWCPVCDKKVSSDARDTRRLLAHVRKYHPEITGKCLDDQREDEEESRTPSNRISSLVTSASGPVGSGGKNQPKKIYATRVDTWKLHGERKVCPQCRKEAVPTLYARGDKLTTSHVGTCLLGCWPLCFLPLMMSRDKNVHTLCPRCGHDYGIRSTDKLVRASSNGRFHDYAMPRRSRGSTKCCSRLQQASKRQHHQNERRFASACESCRNHDKRYLRHDTDESEAAETGKARAESSSGGDKETEEFGFYATQLCCQRESG